MWENEKCFPVTCRLAEDRNDLYYFRRNVMTDKKFTWIKVVAAAVIGALLAILFDGVSGVDGQSG